MQKFKHPILFDYAKWQVSNHLRFLSNVSIKASNNLNLLFQKTIASLTKNALSYPIFYKNYRRVIVSKHYAVFYEIVDDEIFIPFIYDTRTADYNDIVLEKITGE